MRVDSVVNLITNSSTSIYSYAVAEVGERLLKYMDKDGCAIVTPVDFEYVYLDDHHHHDNAAEVDKYITENILATFGTYFPNYNQAHDEDNGIMFDEPTRHGQIYVKNIHDACVDTGLTTEQILQKYPEYYHEYGTVKTVQDLLDEGMPIKDVRKHMDKLVELCDTHSYDEFTPDTMFVFVIDGKVDKELANIVSNLYEHEVSYEG